MAPPPASPSGATGIPPEPTFEKDSRCQQFEALALPPGDEPTDLERAGLTQCDAEALYYGIGSPPDFVVARKCAFVQRKAGEQPVFGGSGMLMMLYANGRGVPQNLDLAFRFACESEGAPAEIEAALATLWDARQGLGSRALLDVCDFTTSGYRAGFCTARDERLAAVKRDTRKAKAMAGLAAKESAALEHATRVFFEARTRSEVDLSGTARAALQIEEQARLLDEYVEMLERLADPTFRPGAHGTEAEVDAALARLVRCKDLGSELADYQGFSRQGFEAAQQAWRAYRDAWIALVLKQRPSRVEAWRGWLIAQRVRMLGEVPLCR